MNRDPAVLPDGLVATGERAMDELRRADGKATTLLSLVGAAFAGVIALTGRHLPAVAEVILWGAAVPMLSAVVLLLSAIRPRLNPDPMPGSWLYAAQVGPASLLESYDAASAPTSTATDVCTLARIARCKYRRIGHAVTLLVIGLGLLAVALTVAGVTS